MITFMDGGGNITLIGTWREWVEFLRGLKIEKLQQSESDGARYIMQKAEAVERTN